MINQAGERGTQNSFQNLLPNYHFEGTGLAEMKGCEEAFIKVDLR